MPNTFAFVVFLATPFFILLFFMTLRRDRAIIISLVATYLLMPTGVGVDLPGFPALTKGNGPGLVILLCLPFFATLQEKTRLDYLVILAGAVYLLAVFISGRLNADPITYGPRVLPGLSMTDSLSFVIDAAFRLLPLYYGMRFLGSAESRRFLALTLFLSGLAYSLLALIEIRLSPQLNAWIYGFYQHSFAQHVRGGGYRPLVFLNHGIWLALYIACAFIAGAALWRQGQDDSISLKSLKGKWRTPGVVTFYMWVVLYLCKSLASLAYGLGAGILMVFFKPKFQIRIAFIMMLAVFSYPALRYVEAIPIGTILSLASEVAPARAESLSFRFSQEDKMLAKVRKRPAFGWSAFGRDRVYNETSGRRITINDSYWIIFLGRYGWTGLLSVMFLLCYPLLAVQRVQNPDFILAGLSLIHAVNLVDLLINATITPLTWLIGGALLAAGIRDRQTAAKAAPMAKPERGRRPRTVL